MSWPEGEAAFVTGAASGIGLGIARALVAGGAKVALADVDAQRLAEVGEELRQAGGSVCTVALDVSDPDQWKQAKDEAEGQLGPISILCNNAGVNGGELLDRTPLEVWRWVNRINLEGQFIGISTFLPGMKERGRPAHIMNTASMAGLIPMPGVGAYVASKYGSVGMSLTLRAELRGTDIVVSLLCPGAVATRILMTSHQGEAALLGQEQSDGADDPRLHMLDTGADPDAVGEQVVEAMRKGQFLIVTHRDYLPLVEQVHREIEHAFTEFDDRYGADLNAQAMLGGESPLEL